MATNSAFITTSNRKTKSPDRTLLWLGAIGFPLIVLAGYAQTYYFKPFFNTPPIANSLVHLHGIVMSVWVIYFASQILLVRTRNLKVHMTMGWVGVALAALVIVVGLATAYDSHVTRFVAPAGIHPYSFLIIPIGDMFYFACTFAAAIYFRKRPAEHKSLMFMTAVNFAAPAIARLPIAPAEHFLLFVFGTPCVIAVAALAWNAWRNGRVNRVFATAVGAFVASQLIRIPLGGTQMWIDGMSAIFGAR